MPVIVNLVRTEGWGLEAEVILEGQKLTVMDTFSPASQPAPPGQLENVQFVANEFTPQTWEEIFSGNPHRLKTLKQARGWRYEGYGEVIGVNPMRIDFGILTLQAGPHTHDERCVGEFVRLWIDRLDLYADLVGGGGGPA